MSRNRRRRQPIGMGLIEMIMKMGGWRPCPNGRLPVPAKPGPELIDSRPAKRRRRQMYGDDAWPRPVAS